MDIELLKIVGQVAGIGGLALGTFILLFREILRKAIFPTLTKAQAYRLLLLLSFFIWTLALAGIGAWMWTQAPPNVQADGGMAAGRDLSIEGSTIRIAPPVGARED